MYGGADFEAVVAQAKRHMDEAAAQLTAGQRSACVRHFRMFTRLEFMFFDAPYKDERWPC